jgi:hypothetical protein
VPDETAVLELANQITNEHERRDDARLHRQALTALRSATRDNLATRSCGHARTEPVSTLTLNFARLISALHAETRRENCAKTSTWWVEKKAGKGTQHIQGCQAHPSYEAFAVGFASLWITRAGSV